MPLDQTLGELDGLGCSGEGRGVGSVMACDPAVCGPIPILMCGDR